MADHPYPRPKFCLAPTYLQKPANRLRRRNSACQRPTHTCPRTLAITRRRVASLPPGKGSCHEHARRRLRRLQRRARQRRRLRKGGGAGTLVVQAPGALEAPIPVPEAVRLDPGVLAGRADRGPRDDDVRAAVHAHGHRQPRRPGHRPQLRHPGARDTDHRDHPGRHLHRYPMGVAPRLHRHHLRSAQAVLRSRPVPGSNVLQPLRHRRPHVPGGQRSAHGAHGRVRLVG